MLIYYNIFKYIIDIFQINTSLRDSIYNLSYDNFTNLFYIISLGYTINISKIISYIPLSRITNSLKVIKSNQKI